MTSTAMEVFTTSGLLVVKEVEKLSSKGAKLNSSTMTVAKSKAVASAFGITGDAVVIKRDEGGKALLTGIVMKVGSLATAPCAIGTSHKTSNLSDGNLRHTFVITEQRAKTASEAAVATYLHKTVEEVRAMRAEAIKSDTTIEVQSEVSVGA